MKNSRQNARMLLVAENARSVTLAIALSAYRNDPCREHRTSFRSFLRSRYSWF